MVRSSMLVCSRISLVTLSTSPAGKLLISLMRILVRGEVIVWGMSATGFRLATFSAEIDISVSKLLGFETFANFLRVSVSVSENLVSEKKSRYRFRKIWYRKKSLGIGFGKFSIRKKYRYRFRKIWYRKK